jgi:hypothetical protein
MSEGAIHMATHGDTVAPAAEIALEVEGLDLYYGDAAALLGVSLTVERRAPARSVVSSPPQASRCRPRP